MTDWYGWAGTILNVDLTNMKLSKEPLTKEFATKYIGGSGFGARILYDEVGPEVDGLDPENIIVIGQGPLSGTTAPSGSRYDLISKSPPHRYLCPLQRRRLLRPGDEIRRLRLNRHSR